MRYILGIDPGLSGAIALYDPLTEELDTIPMPTLKAGTGSKRILNETGLASLFDDKASSIKKVFIERVHAMPKQGVTSMFSFGVSYGIIKGLIAAHFLPVEYVTPQKWKKAMRLTKSKDASRARAYEIFPQFSTQWNLKKDEGRAEAALIAFYGANNLMN